MTPYSYARTMLVLAGLCAGAGCQTGRSFLSIDSDSRMPFFGMQFQRKSRQPDEKPIRSIRQSETAPRPELLDLAEERSARHGWKWFQDPGQPKRIPLPRTDLGDGSVPLEETAASQETGPSF